MTLTLHITLPHTLTSCSETTRQPCAFEAVFTLTHLTQRKWVYVPLPLLFSSSHTYIPPSERCVSSKRLSQAKNTPTNAATRNAAKALPLQMAHAPRVHPARRTP